MKLFLILLLFCTLNVDSTRASDDETDDSFRRAAQLLKPYVVLSDSSAADPTTISGRSQILEAIGLLNTVVKKNPQHWPAWWLIGKGEQALRNHQAAYTSFSQSYSINPSNANVGRELVIEAICVKNTTQAVAIARRISEANPDDAGLLANLGLALLADNKPTAAKSVVEKALQMLPSDGVTRALLNEVNAVQSGHSLSSYCPL